MAIKKLTAQQWEEYLELYRTVEARLKQASWFGEGWEVRMDYLGDKSAPSGVWLRLIKPHWCNGDIHIETWLNNAVLQRGATPVVLHVETSKERHGVNRNDVARRLLERAGDTVAGWPGYTVKPNYAVEPFNTQASFTRQSLPDVLERELSRIAQLGPIIDETLEEVRGG